MNYPNQGPEFKFANKVYHLNVDNRDYSSDRGHISCNRLNEWRSCGKVHGFKFYTVKQALFDIFCLFYEQGPACYDVSMEKLYVNNRQKFDEIAKEWTKKYS